MSIRARSIPLLLPLALLLACGDSEPAPAAQDPAEAHASAPRLGESNEADVTEVADYVLTMDDVRRMHQAQLDIYEAMQANPALAQTASMSAEEFSLDAMETRFAGVPEIRTAIEGAGLEVREYGLIMLALFQASFAQASLDMGAQRDTVLAATRMNPDNLEFVRTHRTELQQMQEELSQAAARVERVPQQN